MAFDVESIRAARLPAPEAKIWLTLHEMLAICLADGQIDCHRCFPDLRPEFFVLRATRLKAALDECDTFFFPTQFLADRYQAWGLDPACYHVVPNGQVHPAPKARRDRHSAHVNRFGYFGQFVDNKGIDVVLEALLLLARGDDVPEAGIELVINGGNRHYASKDYLERVDGLIAAIGREVGDRICDAGRDELADRMAAVDWVIAPSTWWEVFGLMVSEA